MKKVLSLLLTITMAASLAACSTTEDQLDRSSGSTGGSSAKSAMETPDSGSQAMENSGSESTENNEETENISRRISVQFGENTVVYELNDGTAADSLYEQLPLSIEVEDYSTNEKIFYPDETLDTSDAPLAQAGAGTLAYFEPWGDVVFFYGDYNENPALFELGQVVSGGELVSEMSGTILIDTLE